MATVSEIYINPDSQLNNNDINVGRDQLGLCVRINIPNGTVSLNNIWTQSGLPGGLKPNSYIFVNNNVGNCNIILPAIGTTNTTASFGHEMQINNDPASLGTITIQNSAFVNITVLQIGNAATLRAANTGTNTWNVFSPSVNSATPILQGIMYGLTPSVANSNTTLGYQSLNNFAAIGNNNNTVIGYRAGLNLNAGSGNNIIIGSGTGSGFSSGFGNSNIIAMGNNNKFTTNASSSVFGSSFIGNDVLNFVPADPTATNISGTFIYGNNIGPRNNNAIPDITIQDCVFIGDTMISSNAGFSYFLNDGIVIGNNICNSVFSINEGIFLGTTSGFNITALNESVVLTTDGFGSFSGSLSNTTAIGSNIASSMTSGGSSTFVGRTVALSLLTGVGNTLIGETTNAIGAAANNVVVGRASTAGSGSNNIVLGFTAGTGANTGSNNIVIGGLASPATFSNSICLGRSATAVVSNQFVFGSSGTPIDRFTWVATNAAAYNVLGGAGTTLVVDTATGNIGVIPSSRRYKENIIPINDKFDIMKLEPVYFNFINDEKKIKQFGLIAEDVDKAGFNCLVNYVSNYKTKTIEKSTPQPDIITIKKGKEIKVPQDNIITNETVIDTDDNGNPIKLNNDYDDYCPESVNYQMLSVLLLKELKELKLDYQKTKQTLLDEITNLKKLINSNQMF